MPFFKIKQCPQELENNILLELQKRSIPAERDAEMFNRHNIDQFIKKLNSRPLIKLRVLANRLPPWVYALLKIFPFYQAIRQKLIMPALKK
jgi:hypothetical protein